MRGERRKSARRHRASPAGIEDKGSSGSKREGKDSVEKMEMGMAKGGKARE